MAKPYPGIWIIRSMLFTPGQLDRLVKKCAAAPADLIALDLEDAVPPDKKAVARTTIRQNLEAGLFEGKTIMVRLNDFSTGLTEIDVDAVACEQLSGFVHAMTRTPDEIRMLDDMLAATERSLGLEPGHFSIIPTLETALGVINAHPIACASERVVALLFGGEDYLAEMGGRHDAEQLCFHTPRVQVVMAARAAGIEPIDTPHVDVHDEEGAWQHAQRGRALGMAGMVVMSPRQIPIAHTVYTPSEEEVDEAERTLEQLEETRQAGRGMTVQDGKYISPVAENKAMKLMNRARAIRAMEESRDESVGKRRTRSAVGAKH